MARVITSASNPEVKNILRLIDKPKERKEQNLFVVEGVREVAMAINAGVRVLKLLFCPDMIEPERITSFVAMSAVGFEVIEISSAVFDRLAYRAESGGVIALAEPKRLTLDDLTPGEMPLYLVIETVEKPGNLGALLRTADAAAVDAVFVCDPGTDLYNPNVIRSSIGCIFTLPVVVCTSEQAVDWFRVAGIRTFATYLNTRDLYHTADYNQPSAIVMGSEATGLSNIWIEQADALIKIPMLGKIDSMNVSVSAAIVIFEAMRQRDFKKS